MVSKHANSGWGSIVSLINMAFFLPFLSSKLSVMEVIVGFTILALSSVTTPGQIVSPPVASAWLFVCRQLYKTGEGLLVLEHSDLHMHVAKAWKLVSGGCGQKCGMCVCFGDCYCIKNSTKNIVWPLPWVPS